MKITTANYKKVYPGQVAYTTETAGFEASVDEGEDPNDVLEALKNKADMWFMSSRIAEEARQKQEQHKFTYDEVKYNGNLYQAAITKPKTPEEINLQDEKIEIAIDNANTIEELGALRANLPVSLNSMYMKKLNKLTNKIK